MCRLHYHEWIPLINKPLSVYYGLRGLDLYQSRILESQPFRLFAHRFPWGQRINSTSYLKIGFSVSFLQNPSLAAIIGRGLPTAYFIFAQLVIEFMDNNDNMILFMIDKDHLHLNDCINKQNIRFYFSVQWAQRKLLALIFLRTTSTIVNSKHYIKILTQFFAWASTLKCMCQTYFVLIRFGQHNIQLVPQWKLFAKKILGVSFGTLRTFLGPLAPLT